MKFLSLFVILFICSSSHAQELVSQVSSESLDTVQSSVDTNLPQSNDWPSTARPTEDWSVRGQLTYISQQKNNFNSPYHGANSLLNKTEGDPGKSYTFSTTAYLAKRLWSGAELYYNPEIFQGTPFSSGLIGLGGFQNGELQKGMFIPYIYYNARAFVRQTIGLGGSTEYLEGAVDNHLAGYVDKNRVVISYGKVASLDFFDKNTYSHETRTQFMNFSLFSMGAYGYGADMKGFTYGLVAEWYQDDWILKAGRLAVPTEPNQNELDHTLSKDFVDQVELTRKHTLLNHPGALRVLAFHQRAYMATYQDSIAQYYLHPSMGAPNILNSRFGEQNKNGYGLNSEQALSEDIGVFARWSRNDGQTETQTLDISSAVSAGLSIKGTIWDRSSDVVGLGLATNKISAAEINYLQLGGMTMFIGDSAINYKPEQIAEAYYSAKVYKDFYLTADLQRITNPAYNSARGPVNFVGLRLHADF